MRIRTVAGVGEVDPAAWDALAGDDHPFVEHAFLALLESSGSVGPGTGWTPAPVLVEDAGELVGAAPAYLKTHSHGEYVFDWEWAAAFERAGLAYYPKVVVAVPFTPATGPRLLTRPGPARPRIEEALVAGLDALRDTVGGSGVHVLLPLEREAARLAELGFARRATHQFHWRNAGWGSFDDFLASFRSSARKAVRRERRRVAEEGITVEMLEGDRLDAADWRRLYELYLSTSDRKWGPPYLTREFFEGAEAALRHRAVVAAARRDGRTLAASLSFHKGRHLYGRYWGAFEPVEMLHFETCYYAPVEWAIERGLSLVEAGAQGPHKMKRGFLPVVTHSAHRFADPAVHTALRDHLAVEADLLRREVEAVAERGPYRDGEAPDLPLSAGLEP